MNFKGISYYLSLFCFPFSFLAFINIIYSSYFDYFLNIESYVITLIFSLLLGTILFFFGRNSSKNIDFYEQVSLIILIYLTSAILIAIPYYLSNYQITLVDSLFEAYSGITGTGFSIFSNVKYLDPTLIIWRSSSQWIGGLYFLIFLVLFFSNSQFNYKLNDLVFSEKSLNTETNIQKVSLKVFFLYVLLTSLIFFFFIISEVRLFNGLNLSMTLISAGGFLPANSLQQIIRTNTQEFFLIISFLVSILNFYFVYNAFSKKNFYKEHYEDLSILLLIIVFSGLLLVTLSNLDFFDTIIMILTSLGTSGISLNQTSGNLSLYFLFLTIIGGSIISNTSGVKFVRIYILLKASFIEILKLAKPNNVINHNILFSEKKINDNNIRLSFLVFISFFISLFILSGILLFDNIGFENSFKLAILTLTNTAPSEIYGLNEIDFRSLLTNSKIFLIIFMIIGKIELISFFLIIKKFLIKD
ncbi:MAG: potassium transporter Trk [Pelagibacterales bacterium MED-G40]|nr:MAG: potassium transporter Trk [Pelagibacterales bacterium MED-G40]|tara:strand:+ start:8534 stop:9949 length:1416 start_codon:yes stop_codon:yes gene_type:complete